LAPARPRPSRECLMKLRLDATALLIPFTFGLIPIVGMIWAFQQVLLPEAGIVLRMALAVGGLVVAIDVLLRRRLAREAAADIVGLAFLLIGLYPLANALVGRALSIPEFDFAFVYLGLCLASACVPLWLSEDARHGLFGVLGTIAAIFLAFSIALICWAYAFRHPYGAATALAVDRLSSPLPVPRSVSRRPDVFHLVLDGMGRPDVLAERYGLQLDASIEQFRSLGF
jgi:hypothetical protein